MGMRCTPEHSQCSVLSASTVWMSHFLRSWTDIADALPTAVRNDKTTDAFKGELKPHLFRAVFEAIL